MENSVEHALNETRKRIEKTANKLESAEGLVHSSAYQHVRLAVKTLRNLAKQTSPPKVAEPEAVVSLIAELRYYAKTVGQPAGGRMIDAASILEQFL